MKPNLTTRDGRSVDPGKTFRLVAFGATLLLCAAIAAGLFFFAPRIPV